MSKDFTAEPGYVEAYQAQIARAVQAWSAPGAWEGDRSVMGNAMPATDIGAMLIMEMALHGWDIAKATGQDYHCDDDLAQALLDTVRAQGDMFRQYQGFAAIVPVPGEASTFERALGLSGRDPNWPDNDGGRITTGTAPGPVSRRRTPRYPPRPPRRRPGRSPR